MTDSANRPDLSFKGFTHERNPLQTNEDWLTPPSIFDALGVTFALDPCGHPNDYVPARNTFTKAEDGLTQPWSGSVFMNPPYGRETPQWIARFLEHSDGIALVFARTDTKWFQSIGRQVDAICFIAGRVKFLLPDRSVSGTPGSPSMLLAFGSDMEQALRQSKLGVVR